MAQEKEKETKKVEESNCIIAIIWLIAFIIRTYSTCSRRSKAAWQSPNKWSTLTSFCRAHRLYISSCIVCALSYMNNFHYKVYSRLKLDTKVFKVETRGISVASDLHFYLCYIDGEAEVLNSHVFKVPLLLRILECSNAIIWLTIWWNSNEPSYRRPMSFYLRVVGYAVVFWIVSFYFPDWGYTSRHDFAETQLGFFQIQYWMLQNFGQDSIFSPNMEISYYGGKLKNEYFNVEISISEVDIIMCTLFSLIRFVFVFFVVTFHLDMIYRSPYLEHIIVSAQNLNTIRPNSNAGVPNDTHDDAGAQQQSSAETGPEASPSPSQDSGLASHKETAEENPPLNPVESDSEIFNDGASGNLEPSLSAGTTSDTPDKVGGTIKKPGENPESNDHTSNPSQCALLSPRIERPQSGDYSISFLLDHDVSFISDMEVLDF